MKCGKSGEMAHDAENLASTIGDLATGRVHIPDEHGKAPPGGKVKMSGFWLRGPATNVDSHIEYDFVCRRRMPDGQFGPGMCGSIEITRRGPGASGMKPSASVGNLHGLTRQLSRDFSRLYGCSPGAERGFEGARRRRGR